MGLQLGEEGWLLSDSPEGAGASFLPFPRSLSLTCREPRVSVLCFNPLPTSPPCTLRARDASIPDLLAALALQVLPLEASVSSERLARSLISG